MIKNIFIILICIFSCHISFAEQQYTDEEIAKIISAEACSQGYYGMVLVANTIDNRAKKYNKSHWQIATQKNQYHGYTNKNKETIYRGCKKEADDITQQLLNGVLPDHTNGALYFLLDYEARKSWHDILTKKYRDHSFYK